MPPKKAVKESGDDSGKPTKRKAEKSEASPAKKKKPARDSGSGSEDEAPAPVKAAKSAAKGKATVPQVDDGFPRNTTMPTSYSLSTAPSTHIKIVSWNVSSLKAAAKKGLPEYVAAEDADVWLLQETKLQDAKGIDVFDESKYPHQFWLSSEDKKGYSGSAVLSKIKPISSQYGIGVAEHDGEGRTITLEFEKYYIIACCGFLIVSWE